MQPWLLGIGIGVVAGILAFRLWKPLRARWWVNTFEKARKQFHLERERLEARFFEMAGKSGKPRGLVWADCDFEDDVAYARDRRSGELVSLVGVTIRFTAVEGGPMEEVEAVHNLRAATAVFHYQRGKWQTFGRALFNLNPTEAIAHYRQDYEMVGHEPAAPR